MALNLSGKDDNLRRADFRALAATAGLRTGDAEAAIDETVSRMDKALDQAALSQTLEFNGSTRQMIDGMRDICRARTRPLGDQNSGR